MRRVVWVLFFLAIVLGVALPASAQSIVVNGDFSAGNSGFTSQYAYFPFGGGVLCPGGTGGEGNYTVGTNPVTLCVPGFQSFGDHTTGSGQMLIANGAPDTSKIVWQGTINVDLVVGQSYDFSAWVANVDGGAPASLTFKAGGVTIGSITAGGAAGSWQRLFGTFVADAVRPVLTLTNAQSIANGNDFALDDINIFGVGSQTPPGSTPTITGLAPTSGPTAGGTTVVITGTNFTGATPITFGGTAATCTVNSATQITCTTPAHAAGAVDVVVTTPGGTATSAGGFTYIPPPTITGLAPTSGPTAGGTTVVITGTNFTGATPITFGGTAATCTVDSATQITCTTPAHAMGAVDVVVTTPGGSATSAGGFTFIPPAPTITGLAPTAGPIAGGTTVVITGTNFTGATPITFGGTAATCTVNSATQITCTTPAHAAGAVDVVVTTAGGTATSAGGFTYQPPPTVTGLAPASGPIAGGTTVVITGTDLTGGTVTFGGTAATCTVNSATQITCTTPAHVTGLVDVVVTTPGGAITKVGSFTFQSADLAVTLTQSTGTPIYWAALTYTLMVTNVGPQDATSVVLSDVLPASLTFVSLTGPAGWTLTTPAFGSSGTVTATLPTLASGAATQTFTLVVGAHGQPGTSATNTATVSSATPDPVAANNSGSASSTVQPAVPTMGQWAMILMALLFAAGGVYMLRRRRGLVH